MSSKPLGRKAYGSIPHLPGSRLGPGDHHISEGQAKIATEKTRDKHDRVIVQEKLDGSNVAVAKLQDGRIVALSRSGYLASTSPYLQHHLFDDWVNTPANRERFEEILNPGEWISGEWLAQAHGTRYELKHEPFVAFDLWRDGERVIQYDLSDSLERDDRALFPIAALIFNKSKALESADGVIDTSIASVLRMLDSGLSPHGAIDPIEGAVWRVERNGKVEFLCKYVRPEKQDGIYLPEISGKPAVWNKGLEQYLPEKALEKIRMHGGDL